MKKSFLILGILAAMLSGAVSAAPPPEQVPRQQVFQQQASTTEGVVMDGMIAAPTDQDHLLTLVKQLHSPPVMIKTVLPAAENVKRSSWLEAIAPNTVGLSTVSALPMVDGSRTHRMPSNIASSPSPSIAIEAKGAFESRD